MKHGQGGRDPHHYDIESGLALAQHPIHVMLVTFPIALTVATLGGDLFYWWDGDPFFARIGLWTSGWGFGFGVLAAVSGFVELGVTRGIRRRLEPWGHAVAAVFLLAVLAANWALRLNQGAEAAVLPWGFTLSVLGLAAVGLAGWHGGQLVFEHHIGVGIFERSPSPPGRKTQSGSQESDTEGSASTSQSTSIDAPEAIAEIKKTRKGEGR